MLFETFMMYKKYDVVRDVAFVETPTSQYYSCDDYIVKWGQRNRLADSDVKERTILIANMILGRDITSELSSLSSEPIAFETDIGWCSSRNETLAVNSETISYEPVSNGTISLYSAKPKQQVIHDYRDDRIRD
jgi:hypothetical protein